MGTERLQCFPLCITYQIERTTSGHEKVLPPAFDVTNATSIERLYFLSTLIINVIPVLGGLNMRDILLLAWKQQPIAKQMKQITSYHKANASKTKKITIIQRITFRQEPQPSSKSSKMEPIPLNIQPKIPPPVKMMRITTIIPIIASISMTMHTNFANLIPYLITKEGEKGLSTLPVFLN